MTASGPVSPDSFERTQPLPDAVSETYWKAAARGELLLQRCTECGCYQFYPRHCCTSCGGTPEWVASSGRGTLHTFTVIRQNWARGYMDRLPYVVGIVELDEGVRIMTNLTDCVPEEVSIGMPVEVHFATTESGLGIPLWRPAVAAP